MPSLRPAKEKNSSAVMAQQKIIKERTSPVGVGND